MKKIIVALFLGVFLCKGAALAVPIQWKSELGGNDHWYEVFNYTTSWDAAKQLAEQTWYDGLQGHLVTITSIEEQNWLWNALPYSKKWLGGYQADNSIEPDKGWAWVTGEDWTYTNWKDGEPNDNYGDEDYLDFSAIGTGQWNDQRLDGWNKVTGYVVEYESVSAPVPEPTTMLLLGTGLIGLVGFRRKFLKR